MSRVRLEVCCGSADDVIQAHRAGADRVDLNSDLFHGVGLSPPWNRSLFRSTRSAPARWA